MNIMPEMKAEFIANQIVSNPALSYEEHAQVICPQVDPSAQRQSIYQYLQKPIVQAKIAEKTAKIFNVEELQQINSRRIKQLDETFRKRKKLTSKDAKLLSVEDSIIQTAGKFQSAFVQKSVNLTVVAQLQADKSTQLSTQQLIDSITSKVRDTTQQGRGEGETA